MGIEYRRVDISADPESREYVMALGYLQVPVVHAGPEHHFAGYKPDRLKALTGRGAA
jgi:glutaredoxin-like protein NrdH